LRHHFVTRALENGADLMALSEMVGSRPETLMKNYQHVTRKMHRETMDRIPGLGIQNIPKSDRKEKDGNKSQIAE